jgi:UDP-N-acetylmuramate dehydrogenase
MTAALAARFGERLARDVSLARYTAARIGGPADWLLVVKHRDELHDAVRLAWDADLPLVVLGGGANVLVDDGGFRGLVVINRAQNVHLEMGTDRASVRADSGVSLSTLARQCIGRGAAGLEWGVSVPGTLGGAVINNAGAFGGDMAAVVQTVDVLPRGGAVEVWPVEAISYAYRESRLKRSRSHLVLGAALALGRDDPDALRARAEEITGRRKATQPPGASLGSIFKNPPDDYAGRLIEAAGLKGKRIGEVTISPVHANFFVNAGGATAADYRALIDLARETVEAKFGVSLELEIELIGHD